MPTPTTNHDFDVYDVGEEAPWTHGPTLEALDTKVEIRDVEANLPNYTPVNRAKYFTTDTGRIYLGDGTSWTRGWDLDAIGLTERNPDSLTVGPTQTAMIEMRSFEQFSTDSISISDGGSVHIRRLRHLMPP